MISGTSSAVVLNSSAVLYMQGGSLQFMDTGGVIIEAGHTSILDGGSIWINGDFTVYSTAFNNAGGDLYLGGDDPYLYLYLAAGSVLNNVLLYTNPGCHVNLASDLMLNGNLFINNGASLDLQSHTLTVYGTVTVWGIIYLMNSSTLRLGTSFLVQSGGTLFAEGSENYQGLITRIGASGDYDFTIAEGGTIVANHTTFEYMNAEGINIQSGAIVDSSHCFSLCIFRNGASGGSLLTVNNSQDLNPCGVTFFDSGSAAHNVSKTSNQGSLNFICATGDFSGTFFENDPDGRINWNSILPPVQDVSILLDGNPPNLHLSINYPYIVDRIDVYESENPYGPFIPVFSFLGSFHNYNYTAPLTLKKFYRVIAVLE